MLAFEPESYASSLYLIIPPSLYPNTGNILCNIFANVGTGTEHSQTHTDDFDIPNVHKLIHEF